MRHCSFLPAFGLFCGLLTGGSATAQVYTVTELGTLPGANYGVAVGINEAGQVVGYGGTLIGGFPLGERTGFLYSDGKLTAPDLPNQLEGPTGIAGGASNEERRKLRITGTDEFSGVIEAYLYEDHLVRALGVLPGGQASSAAAVNSLGEVVGTADPAGYPSQPMLYRHGNMVSLGTLQGPEGSGAALGINDHSDVTGWSSLADGNSHAFLYHRDKMYDLGTLPGLADSEGAAINNSLEVAGFARSADYSVEHAFLWSHGKMKDLGALPTGTMSTASSINNWGEVVGSGDFDTYYLHAFLYSHGQMHDLNDMIPANAGLEIFSASQINDRGEIAATATSLTTGGFYAVLLTLDCKDSRNKDCDRCKQ